MKPIRFKDSNVELTAPNCHDLPAFADGEYVVSCWRPTIGEKLKLMVWPWRIRVWLLVHTGKHTQPPVLVQMGGKVLEKKER